HFTQDQFACGTEICLELIDGTSLPRSFDSTVTISVIDPTGGNVVDAETMMFGAFVDGVSTLCVPTSDTIPVEENGILEVSDGSFLQAITTAGGPGGELFAFSQMQCQLPVISNFEVLQVGADYVTVYFETDISATTSLAGIPEGGGGF